MRNKLLSIGRHKGFAILNNEKGWLLVIRKCIHHFPWPFEFTRVAVHKNYWLLLDELGNLGTFVQSRAFFITKTFLFCSAQPVWL